MNREEKINHISFYGFMLSVNLLFLFAAVWLKGESKLSDGLFQILTSFTGSTTDFFAIGGLAPTLLNVSLNGFFAFLVMASGKTNPSGLGLMSYMITLGFSFYGKTLFASLPIVCGVYFYSRLNNISWGQNTPLALFSCSLAPLVTLFAFHPLHQDWPLLLRLIMSIAMGLMIGLVLPIISKHTPNIHKGFNIYNVGLSGGLLTWFVYQLYRSIFLARMELDTQSFTQKIFGLEEKREITIIYLILFSLMLLWGFFVKLSAKPETSLMSLFKRSGHNTDFVKTDGLAPTFWNMSVIGFLGLAYLHLVSAPFTGPTVGALLSAVCLSANGVNPLNAWPILVGYLLASIVMPFTLASQVQLTTLPFALALSPIAGVFGWFWGIIGGFAHAAIAPYSAPIHGGLTLYNGGFSAGIIASILVPLAEHLTNKKPKFKA